VELSLGLFDVGGRMTSSDYIRSFLEELERAKPRESYSLSHAIALQNGKLCVLLSLGDARAKIYMEELDPNPVRAAESVAGEWRTLKNDFAKIEFE
jgi:hypothetical protein